MSVRDCSVTDLAPESLDRSADRDALPDPAALDGLVVAEEPGEGVDHRAGVVNAQNGFILVGRTLQNPR
jgi:hypothetical protein